LAGNLVAAPSCGHVTTTISSTGFAGVANALLELPRETVIDGEIVALD